MAAIKNTGLSVKGLRSDFFEAHDRVHTTESVWEQLCTVIPSKADSETYKWIGSIPQPREWGSGRKAKGVGTESYTVANLKYESTIEVDQDEIDDDQTGQIRMRIQELGERAARFKDFQLETLITSGSTAGFESYDGTEFFAADHVSGASGSQDNELTSSATSADAPTTAEIQLALDLGVETLMTWKDDLGVVERRGFGKLIILCHPRLWRNFETAINAGLITAGNTNVQLVIPKIIPMAGFSDVSQWYLFRVDGVMKPFIMQKRRPMRFDVQAEGSTEQFHKEKHYYGVSERYRLTYGEWKHAVSINFT